MENCNKNDNEFIEFINLIILELYDKYNNRQEMCIPNDKLICVYDKLYAILNETDATLNYAQLIAIFGKNIVYSKEICHIYVDMYIDKLYKIKKFICDKFKIYLNNNNTNATTFDVFLDHDNKIVVKSFRGKN